MTKHESTVVFANNSADNGGAVSISTSALLITENTNVTFDNNTTGKDSGAIYFNDHINAIFKNSTITLNSNTAVVMVELFTLRTKFFNRSGINISDNIRIWDGWKFFVY